MFDQYHLGNIIFLVHLPLRCRGNQRPVLSQRPVSQLTESRALRVVDFGRATRIRHRMRILVFAIGSWTRLLRILGILQGMPESLRICAELQTGAGFHSQPDVGYRNDNDDDDRDSEANVTQSDRNFVRLMHSIHNRFTYSVPASAPREHPRWELGYVFSTSEVTSSAHYDFVSASG